MYTESAAYYHHADTYIKYTMTIILSVVLVRHDTTLFRRIKLHKAVKLAQVLT